MLGIMIRRGTVSHKITRLQGPWAPSELRRTSADHYPRAPVITTQPLVCTLIEDEKLPPAPYAVISNSYRLLASSPEYVYE